MTNDKFRTLTALPGSGQSDAFAEAVRNIKKNAELLVEYWAIEARIRRAKYLSFVKEGFTEVQALEMCKV